MSDAAAPDGGGQKPGITVKGRVAVIIGNWLEFYDFLVYSFFAVMIGNAFFPGESDGVKLLASLATFGVGFFTRPLGAAVIGAYADRAGRKAALTLTLLLMAVGTGLVAVTPGYETIGIAAPIILVIARLIQGFSCGGEVGPATTYLMEAATPEKRAAHTAWQGHSQQIAIIAGSLTGVILAAVLSEEALYDWGWRIPFGLGLVVAPVGIYIRRQLPDTIAESEKHVSALAVLSNLMRDNSGAVILGILVICGSTISTYIFNYMTTYAITTLKLSAFVGNLLTLSGATLAIVGIAVGVWLDRFGRKSVIVSSRVVFIVSLYPAYLMMTAPATTAIAVLAINMYLSFVFYIAIGGLYALLTESLPKAVRASGLSILYALSVTIFGGTTQFVVAWLIQTTGDPLVPAWYQLGFNIVSVVAVLLLTPHAEVLRERSAATVGGA